MLRKIISGICVLGLVCTLMTGCTEDELNKIEEKAQEYDRQYEKDTGSKKQKDERHPKNNRTYENKTIRNNKK